MQPTLILLCGLPGSGKSSYSKPLSGLIKVVSEDALLDRLVKDGLFETYRDAWQSEAEAAHLNAMEELYHAETNRVDVMFDGINLSRARRAEVLDLFPGYEKIAVYWDYPLEITRLRLAERLVKTRKQVPFEAVAKMAMYYEFPIVEEGFDEVHAIRIPPLSS